MRKIISTILMMCCVLHYGFAGIVYTDPADVQIQAGGTLDIDLNNDGTAEFTLEDLGFGGTAEIGTMFDPAEVNFVTWSAASDWDAFKPLNAGANINDNSGFYAQGDCYFNPFWADQNHQFPTGSDEYIGVKFKIGSASHYAWIRVQLHTDGTLTVKDYAYESTAGNAIAAGDEGGGTSISNTSSNPISVYPNPAQDKLHINALPYTHCEVRIFDAQGKIVWQQELPMGENSMLDVHFLEPGIYLLNLHTNGGENYSSSFIKL